MGTRSRGIVEWLARRLAGSGKSGFVLGLSGGLDSAVVLRLCQLAAPDRVTAVMMPCHGDPADEADALEIARHFGIAPRRLDLAPAYDRLIADIGGAFPELIPPAGAGAHAARLPLANLKARLRMASLYVVANSLDCLVAGTGNRSELLIGYFTKHGDGASDLLPIGGLLKGEVRTLARELDVPPAIVDKVPSAGLWAGQTDEAEMGFTYTDLERYVISGPDTVAPALAMRIERLMRASDHKRALPPTPDDDDPGFAGA